MINKYEGGDHWSALLQVHIIISRFFNSHDRRVNFNCIDHETTKPTKHNSLKCCIHDWQLNLFADRHNHKSGNYSISYWHLFVARFEGKCLWLHAIQLLTHLLPLMQLLPQHTLAISQVQTVRRTCHEVSLIEILFVFSHYDFFRLTPLNCFTHLCLLHISSLDD